MNIPDDPFFAMLMRSLQARAGETLQRRLYSTLREAIMQGQLRAQSWLPVRGSWRSGYRFHAIPSMQRWSSWRWKGICIGIVAARG